MKFKNIKVGDTVYIQYKVGGMGGFHSSVYGEFFLPKEVTKITAKFFDADGMRFYKENGLERASGYGIKKAFFLGDTDFNVKVKDETEEHSKAILLLRKLEKVKNLMDRYYIDHKAWSEEDLDTLFELLTKNAPKK